MEKYRRGLSLKFTLSFSFLIIASIVRADLSDDEGIEKYKKESVGRSYFLFSFADAGSDSSWQNIASHWLGCSFNNKLKNINYFAKRVSSPFYTAQSFGDPSLLKDNSYLSLLREINAENDIVVGAVVADIPNANYIDRIRNRLEFAGLGDLVSRIQPNHDTAVLADALEKLSLSNEPAVLLTRENVELLFDNSSRALEIVDALIVLKEGGTLTSDTARLLPMSGGELVGQTAALLIESLKIDDQDASKQMPEKENISFTADSRQEQYIDSKEEPKFESGIKPLPAISDSHWYSDDDINHLLNYYIKEQGVEILCPINLEQHDGATLAENLRDRVAGLADSSENSSSRTNTLVLPINLGSFNPDAASVGVHWAALYIYYPSIHDGDSESGPIIVYLDPAGNPISDQLHNILQQQFGQTTIQNIVDLNIRFQFDGHSCGPWVVELLRHLVEHRGASLPGVEFDINAARIEHSGVFQQNVSSIVSHGPASSTLAVNVKNAEKNDEVELINASRRCDLRLVENLIARGVNLDATDSNGQCALMHAAIKGHTSMAKLLLDSGAKLNQVDKNGWTVLMYACRCGRVRTAEFLIDRGAELSACTIKGWTSLIFPSREGNVAVVKLLLEKGADPDAVTKSSWTALMFAVYFGHAEVVKLLLDADANTSLTNDKGKTALSYALKKGDREIEKLLLNKELDMDNEQMGSPTAGLIESAMSGSLENVREFLDGGADIDQFNGRGWNALMYASLADHIRLVELLIERGAKLDITNNQGESAFMIASQRGNLEILRLLLEEGVDPNIQNESGWNALMLSSFYGHTEVVKFLLDVGVKIDAFNNKGCDALYYAFVNKHTKIMELLQKKGARLKRVRKYVAGKGMVVPKKLVRIVSPYRISKPKGHQDTLINPRSKRQKNFKF